MIPSGTVTFLFTEIEDSTKLAEENPQKIQAAFAKHHSILEKAITENNGHIFEIVSEAFCTSFAGANDALNAAIDIQRNISKENWNEINLNVRIGIHTGIAEFTDGNYVGYIVLARTHRVMSVSNGGQILLTQDTYDLAQSDNTGKYLFIDLGERRLKDLIRPVHLYQLILNDLPSDFPSLKTIDAISNNLPIQLTTFIGREKQMAEIKKLLSDTRLLTLFGAGGTGKTRLALQVGADMIHDFENGVWITELASLNEPQFIYHEIASSFKLNSGSNSDDAGAVLDFLREKELLLILDNCEHLINESAFVAENILKHCKKIKILATSREVMNLDGETIFRIPSLSLPGKDENFTAETLSQFEAVRLFIDRALLIKNDFKITNKNAPALAELCYRLDGIPLAIELAAARVSILSVEKILEKLGNMFNLLTGGRRTSLPRQQTLRALIDWSYDLLSGKEKLLLQRLTVFSGGWNLEAAKEICSYGDIEEDEILDLISNLLGKSLIIMNEEEVNRRYNMLETIRQYGIEKLTDSAEIHLRHTDYFCKCGRDWSEKIDDNRVKERIDLLESEHDNFRAAINWSIDNMPEKALEIVESFEKFLEIKAYFSEGMLTSEKVLRVNLNSDKRLRGNVLLSAGHCATMAGEFEKAHNFLKEGLNLFTELGNKEETGHFYNSLGLLNYYTGKFEESKNYYEQSLLIFKEVHSEIGTANSLINLGALVQTQGNYELAMKHYKTALASYEKFNQTHSISRSIANISTIEYYLGNYAKAIVLYEDCLVKFREVGDNDGLSATLLNIGNAYFNLKDFINAEKYYNESLSISRHFGYKNLISNSEIRLGDIALTKGEAAEAMKIYTDCISRLDESEELHSMANCFKGLGFVYKSLGNTDAAIKMLAVFKSIFEKLSLQLPKAKREELDEVIQDLKSAAGESEFSKLWNEGGSLNITEALEIVFMNSDSKRS